MEKLCFVGMMFCLWGWVFVRETWAFVGCVVFALLSYVVDKIRQERS